jgi:hypothetical protein
MQAIEFETYIKDGMIKIPDNMNKFKNKKIKIIIMAEDTVDENLEKKQRVNKFKHFQEFVKSNTKDLQFDKNIDIDKIANDINEVNL